MSDFFETIQKRRSVHAFSNRALEEGFLPQVLEAARLAPSAGNLQAYEIYLISSQANRTSLADAALNQDFIAQAPVSLVFCTNAGRSSINMVNAAAAYTACRMPPLPRHSPWWLPAAWGWLQPGSALSMHARSPGSVLRLRGSIRW